MKNLLPTIRTMFPMDLLYNWWWLRCRDCHCDHHCYSMLRLVGIVGVFLILTLKTLLIVVYFWFCYPGPLILPWLEICDQMIRERGHAQFFVTFSVKDRFKRRNWNLGMTPLPKSSNRKFPTREVLAALGNKIQIKQY